MSLFVKRPHPFCNAHLADTSYTTPAVDRIGGNLTAGTLWDGTTYDGSTPPADVFGPGTGLPIGLTFEQMQRWYNSLDVWQFTVSFDAGYVINGIWDGTPGSYFIDYNEFPDGGTPDPTMPLRKRITGRTVNTDSQKVTAEFTPDKVVTTLQMNFASVLIDLASSPRLYYPGISFSVYPPESVIGGGGVTGRQGANTLQTLFLGNPLWPAIDTGVTFDIDDQAGGVFNIPIYRDNADAYPSGPATGVNAVLVTAAAAKPTGYL